VLPTTIEPSKDEETIPMLMKLIPAAVLAALLTTPAAADRAADTSRTTDSGRRGRELHATLRGPEPRGAGPGSGVGSDRSAERRRPFRRPVFPPGRGPRRPASCPADGATNAAGAGFRAEWHGAIRRHGVGSCDERTRPVAGPASRVFAAQATELPVATVEARPTVESGPAVEPLVPGPTVEPCAPAVARSPAAVGPLVSSPTSVLGCGTRGLHPAVRVAPAVG